MLSKPDSHKEPLCGRIKLLPRRMRDLGARLPGRQCPGRRSGHEKVVAGAGNGEKSERKRHSLTKREVIMMGAVDLFTLEGKVAIVTGASVGLGACFAEAMAEAGGDWGGADCRDELLD